MEDQIVEIDPTNDVAPAGETAEQKVTRLEAANAKLYARTKDAEAEAKALKSKPSISEVSTKVDVRPSDILKADEFKLYRAGYSEQEIDLIMHNGGAKILEDKASPLVLGLQAAKEQRKAESAAEAANGSSGLSDIERKYSEAEMRAMPTAELEKLIPHVNN